MIKDWSDLVRQLGVQSGQEAGQKNVFHTVSNWAAPPLNRYGYEGGSIDLGTKVDPLTRNADGSYSTTRTASAGMGDGMNVLYPTVINRGNGWYVADDSDALNHARESGKTYGTVATVPRAIRASQYLHDALARAYEKHPEGNYTADQRWEQVKQADDDYRSGRWAPPAFKNDNGISLKDEIDRCKSVAPNKRTRHSAVVECNHGKPKRRNYA